MTEYREQISGHESDRQDARQDLMPGAAIYSSLHLRKLLPAVILTFFLIVLMSACGNSPNVASLQKFDLDGVPAAPAWVAFKDGDGPWQQIATPSANLVWSHTVTDPAGRYAFAVVTASEQFLEIYAGTLSEISRFSALEFPTAIPATPVSVSGTVSGSSGGRKLGNKNRPASCPWSHQWQRSFCHRCPHSGTHRHAGRPHRGQRSHGQVVAQPQPSGSAKPYANNRFHRPVALRRGSGDKRFLVHLEPRRRWRELLYQPRDDL